MPKPTFNGFTRRRQKGTAATEYIVVSLFLVLVLLTGPNVIKQLMDAFKSAYAAFLYTLSATLF